MEQEEGVSESVESHLLRTGEPSPGVGLGGEAGEAGEAGTPARLKGVGCRILRLVPWGVVSTNASDAAGGDPAGLASRRSADPSTAEDDGMSDGPLSERASGSVALLEGLVSKMPLLLEGRGRKTSGVRFENARKGSNSLEAVAPNGSSTSGLFRNESLRLGNGSTAFEDKGENMSRFSSENLSEGSSCFVKGLWKRSLSPALKRSTFSAGAA